LQRKKTSSEVAKYAHSLDNSQCLSEIELNIFPKEELLIKVKAQVLPVSLGFKNRSANC